MKIYLGCGRNVMKDITVDEFETSSLPVNFGANGFKRTFPLTQSTETVTSDRHRGWTSEAIQTHINVKCKL